jgi:nucleoid-associated protein YgaU
LVEYKEYGKQIYIVKTGTKTATLYAAPPSSLINPKNSGTYTVVKGDSLWAIAKKFYGDGSKYTKIASANKDKIKNPSLIYPGQKLVIPI